MNAAAKTMYNYAPELDSHMKTSLKNLNDAEDSLNTKWEYNADIQVAANHGHKKAHHHTKPVSHHHHLTQSDPIESSAGEHGWNDHLNGRDGRRKKKEINYNFNPKLDGDIIDTHENLENTEETMGHKWKWTASEDLPDWAQHEKSAPKHKKKSKK